MGAGLRERGPTAPDPEDMTLAGEAQIAALDIFGDAGIRSTP